MPTTAILKLRMLDRHIFNYPKLPPFKPIIQIECNQSIQTAKPFLKSFLKKDSPTT
jgi:hypothetical protein